MQGEDVIFTLFLLTLRRDTQLKKDKICILRCYAAPFSQDVKPKYDLIKHPQAGDNWTYDECLESCDTGLIICSDARKMVLKRTEESYIRMKPQLAAASWLSLDG